MKYSIIIPTYNHLEDCLKPCIESIIKYTDLSEVEVIVVANGCTDGTEDYIKSLGNPFKLILINEKLGYTKSVNLGMKSAIGDYIVNINNDIILLPQNKNDWLNKLQSPFRNPKIGLTGIHQKKSEETDHIFYCFYCVMIKKEVFNKVGLLDEVFNPGWGEDIDYCRRIELSGYELSMFESGAEHLMSGNLLVGDFPIYHPGTSTFHDKEHQEKYEAIVQRNIEILKNKYSKMSVINKKYEFLCKNPSDINEHLPILRKYAEKCNHITEFGVRSGVSTWAFLSARPKKMNSYDWHRWDKEVTEIEQTAKNENINFNFYQQDVLQSNIEQTDLLFIDSLHNYFHLTAELNLHSRKVNKYIIFHDTESHGEFGMMGDFNGGWPGGEGTGLLRAINEFLERDKTWKIKEDLKNCGGLIVLEKVNSIKKYSIIIPTYNHLEDCLKPCINSIINYTDLSEVEVIVVANGCTDGTEDYVKSLGKTFRIIEHKDALGYTKAINKGIKSANGEYVILLGNDTEILESNRNDWIKKLETPFSNPKVGITGPQRQTHPETNIDFLVFFCVMIKKEVINNVGLLDEVFNPGYGEDIDYCQKIKNANYKIVQVPQEGYEQFFPIFHKAGQTVKHIDAWNDIVLKNTKILCDRYGKIKTQERVELLEQQDSFVYNEIFKDNVYGVLEDEVKDKIVIDAGGNRGFFSIFCSTYKPKKIYTIEANPNIFSILQNNTNGMDIELIPLALFDSDNQEVTISDNGGKSTIGEPGLITKTITLQSLLNKFNIIESDLVLKLDIEGSEFNVILNSTDDLIKRFKTIYLEIHSGINSNPEYKDGNLIRNKLKKLGFVNSTFVQMVAGNYDEFGSKINEKLIPVTIEKWTNNGDISDSKELPDGFFDDCNIQFIRDKLEEVPENGTVVQLGVYKGKSICCASDIIKRKNIKTIVVDTFYGDKDIFAVTGKTFKENEILLEFLKNIDSFGISNLIQILRMRTDEGHVHVPDHSVDMLFIDACHDYECVISDLINWVKKVKPNGIISGHDFHHPPIQQALNEFFKDQQINKYGTPPCNIIWELDNKKHEIVNNTPSNNYIKHSIVIPTYNHLEDYLKPCIESIIRNTNLFGVEIIISANGCTDGTKEYVNSLPENFKLVWSDSPLGFAKAVNAGIKASSGEFITLLNNDTLILDKSWLDRLEAPFIYDSEVGITGPILNVFSPTNHLWFAFFCNMIKRKVFDKIGLLDEIFGVGNFEDIDFCIKATINGFKLVAASNDPVINQATDTRIIGQFPIFHVGGGTMTNMPEWSTIANKNYKIIIDRYLDYIVEDGLHFKYNLACKTTSDINEHLPVLRNYAKECKHITEMGVRCGNSSLALLSAFPEKYVGYDIVKQPEVDSLKEMATKLKINFNFKQENTLTTTIEETDLLFIDTFHHYNNLSVELNKHGNKAKKYIILHDTVSFGDRGDLSDGNIPPNESTLGEYGTGLNRAISEFLTNNSSWSIKEHFENCNGLTILEKNQLYHK